MIRISMLGHSAIVTQQSSPATNLRVLLKPRLSEQLSPACPPSLCPSPSAGTTHPPQTSVAFLLGDQLPT